MNLKVASLATCLAGWLLLTLSFLLTRVLETDSWKVVVPLTVHLFAYLTMLAAALMSGLWMVALGRWQEDMGVAGINLLLSGLPVVYLVVTYVQSGKPFTRFIFSLMWTGNP